jgi:hypothetical protein
LGAGRIEETRSGYDKDNKTFHESSPKDALGLREGEPVQEVG